MRSTQQTDRKVDITLGEINELLIRAGLPAIPREKAESVILPQNKARFIEAVFVAHENPSAARYAGRVLMAAGLEVSFPPEASNQEPEQRHQPEAQNIPVDSQGRAAPAHQMSDQNRSQRNNTRSDTNSNPGNQGNQAASRNNNPALPGREKESEAEVWGESFHVYGGKAALCFTADTTRRGDHTIALDGASLLAPKTYDWKNKIRIQLTRGELPVVAAVLLGFKQECEFKNHGPSNDKGFSLKRQDGGKIFASVFAAGQPVKAVPVFAPDLMWVAALVLQQVQKNCPGIDSSGVINLIEATQSIVGNARK